MSQNQDFTGRSCSVIAYVCPMVTSNGLHFINSDGATPEDIAKWKSTGYFKARVIAIEVQDENV